MEESEKKFEGRFLAAALADGGGSEEDQDEESEKKLAGRLHAAALKLHVSLTWLTHATHC